MTALSEQARVEAAQRDPAKFEDLYTEHFYRVYAYVVRRVGSRAAAEDLTAHVFQEALANLGKFEWRGTPFAAWLFRIAANAVHDHWLRRSRESGAPRAVDPTLDAEEVERHAALFQLVERLPEAQRRVIEMRFVEEKSIREVADAIGRSEGAVKQLQLRALETLRAQWEGGR
jgi:RNA polymerase sigma-70 factor (ECF subfamily)